MGINFEGVDPKSNAKLNEILKDNKISKEEMQGLTAKEKEALAKAFGGKLPPVGEVVELPKAKRNEAQPEDKGIFDKLKGWAKENPVKATLGALAIVATGGAGLVAAGVISAGTAGAIALGGAALVGLSSCSEENIEQNVQVTIDYKNDKVEDIYNQLVLQGKTLEQIVNLLIANNRSSSEILKLLTSINVEESKQTELLSKLVGNNDEAIGYLKEIIALQKKGITISEGNQNLLNQILEKMDKLGDNKNIENVLNEILKNVKISIQNQEKMDDKSTKFYNDIIGILNKFGDSIDKGVQGTDEIVALLNKVIKNQGDNTNAIIDAMGKIKVEGGKIDLSSVEEMLRELLDQSKKNGDTLTSIDGKMDVVNVTTKAILAKLEGEFGKNDTRYKNIVKLLEALGDKAGSINEEVLLDKLDKILAKLNDILAAIKDHDVKVTVDDVTGKVTCECNCGNKNHEGIDQLNNLLK